MSESIESLENIIKNWKNKKDYENNKAYIKNVLGDIKIDMNRDITNVDYINNMDDVDVKNRYINIFKKLSTLNLNNDKKIKDWVKSLSNLIEYRSKRDDENYMAGEESSIPIYQGYRDAFKMGSLSKSRRSRSTRRTRRTRRHSHGGSRKNKK